MKNKKSRDPASIRIIPRNRSGSHVGMILSFVIFITFLVFLYVVVNPSINIGTDKGKVIDYIESEITKNTSSNLTSTSIDISSGVVMTSDCVVIGNLFILLGIPANIKIKNETGDLQEVYTDIAGGGPRINRKSQDNLFFKMYYSPEFALLGENNALTCQTITDTEYSIGLVKMSVYIFEDNLIALISYYNDNYESLKREFNIPSNNEFGFEFVKSDGTKTTADQETTSGEVYAENIPIQYVDENANIQTGFINIKVW